MLLDRSGKMINQLKLEKTCPNKRKKENLENRELFFILLLRMKT